MKEIPFINGHRQSEAGQVCGVVENLSIIGLNKAPGKGLRKLMGDIILDESELGVMLAGRYADKNASRALSIGFYANHEETMLYEKKGQTPILTYLKSTLQEVSAVAVPRNVDAKVIPS